MRRRMLKSKIHRATVTDANLHYVGSITLDAELMRQADILEWEQVTVVDIDNGARFETYAIVGGPGDCCLNGAAARLVQRGDRIIVMTYADFDDVELDGYAPTVVHVDRANRSIDENMAQLEATMSRAGGPVHYADVPSAVDRLAGDWGHAGA